MPATDPVIATVTGHAYMSWRGATGVHSWDIYEGTIVENAEYTHTVVRTQFETETQLRLATLMAKVIAVTSDNIRRGSETVFVV
jgi:hypothetical protein